LSTLRFLAPEAERLDRAVAGRVEVGSRSLAERLIADGAVLVDGAPRAKSHRLEGGEEVVVELPAETGPLAAEEMDLDVVWEDEHLLVVDKPAGVVVHPGTGHRSGTLVHGLLAHDAAGGDEDRPGIVHRLDRDTSGLLVVARSDEAHARLQELIRRRAVDRRYLALVKGTPRSRSGRIEGPIGRDRVDKSRHSLDTATPREAVTHFEVLELLGPRALLELRLETGRTHQIRVHLAHIGHPLMGDPVYGPGFKTKAAKLPQAAADSLTALGRQALHAYLLVIVHPVTGDVLEFRTELPADLARLRKSFHDAGPQDPKNM
jgi:23S rRNA pseudouridine1911/1915/1917 synthase